MNTRNVAALLVMGTIGLDLVAFVVGGVAGSLHVVIPASSLSLLSIVNGAAWALALMDDGRGL